jgi:quercetin dioxygenase-like cupin family protein
VIVSKETAEHYSWGDACDGWILSPSPELMVIQERMPPHTSEQRHLHNIARQFFFVLSGELTMELEGEFHRVPMMSGIEIRPLSKHQARNDSDEEVHFLVVSSPTTRGDRTDVSSVTSRSGGRFGPA